ncbi:MAG: hypothetical protein LBR34_11475 [Prevotella sp.]|nr:hypothetical protein [Prevotella sp.]
MRFTSKIKLWIIAPLLFVSCGNDNKEARLYLENIRKICQQGDYAAAEQKIDSIQILYPKAFEQIKEGLKMLREVRWAQNTRQIIVCDSLIGFLTPKIDSLKQYFTYDINKEYQETGRFLPKGFPSNLSAAALRAGVEENGQLFIESVFTGGGFHNQASASMPNGFFVETLPVNDDGLNFRYSDSGKQYEIIKFSGADENGLARFIYAYSDMPMSITLKGKNVHTFPLSKTAQKGIADSYLLSLWMQQADSLKQVKEKTEMLIQYLKEK